MTETTVDFDAEAKKVKDQFEQLNKEKQLVLQQRANLDRALNEMNVRMVKLQGSWETLMTISGKALDGNPLVVPEKPKQEVKKTTVKKKTK